MHKLIGLDIATSFGWAVMDNEGARSSGVWDLKHDSSTQGPGMRLIWLHDYLEALLTRVEPDIVGYELVRQVHKSSAAAHWYGAYLGKVFEICDRMGIPYTGVEVGAIKKLATNNGNASKEMMIAAAKEQLSWTPTSKGAAQEDEADARWVLEWLREKYNA